MNSDEYFRNNEPVFGEWFIKEKIGAGSFGQVFRITDIDETREEALKIISIPDDASEIKTLYSQGMNTEAVTEYFSGVAGDVMREVELMEQLSDCENVVRCKESRKIKLTESMGYQVLIRMELLEPVNSHINKHGVTRNEVVQIGLAIAKALECCHAKNIIHRDIKTGNIFVSSDGVYKVGDFGISRTLEKTKLELSRKGTMDYMAPEVYKGEDYGKNIDIYSLGVVLYKLLNGNRAPFMPDWPEQFSYADTQKAIRKRMLGEEEIPAPRYAGENLARIVLKMIRYNPDERFRDAKALINALENLDLAEGFEAAAAAQKFASAAGSASDPDSTSDADSATGPDIAADPDSTVVLEDNCDADRILPGTQNADAEQVEIESYGRSVTRKKRPILFLSRKAKILVLSAALFVLCFSVCGYAFMRSNEVMYFYQDTQNGKYGYLNEKGDEDRNIPAAFDFATVFTDGLAAVGSDGKYWAINKKGESLFGDKTYTDIASRCTEGRIAVADENSMWAFVDKNNKQLTSFKYEYLYPFSEGMAAFCKYDKKGEEKWGFLAINMEEKIKAEYDSVSDFVSGVAVVCNYDETAEAGDCENLPGLYKLIDKDGRVVKDLGKCSSVTASGKPGDYLCVVKDDEVFYIDADGKTAISSDRLGEFESCGDFFEKRAKVCKNDKCGFIDENGKLIGAGCVYDAAGDFSDGMAIVCKNGKNGYMNSDGEIVLEIEYDGITDFSNGVGAVKKSSKWVLVDKNGKDVGMLGKRSFSLCPIESYAGSSVGEAAHEESGVDRVVNRAELSDGDAMPTWMRFSKEYDSYVEYKNFNNKGEVLKKTYDTDLNVFEDSWVDHSNGTEFLCINIEQCIPEKVSGKVTLKQLDGYSNVKTDAEFSNEKTAAEYSNVKTAAKYSNVKTAAEFSFEGKVKYENEKLFTEIRIDKAKMKKADKDWKKIDTITLEFPQDADDSSSLYCILNGTGPKAACEFKLERQR